jgi:hypothetical protein
MEQPKRQQQTSARLSDTALACLTALKLHYGLSTTALFEFLLREAARHASVGAVEIDRPRDLAVEQPAASPLASPLTSEVAFEEDEDEIDAQGFRRQIALQHMIDRQREESK